MEAQGCPGTDFVSLKCSPSSHLRHSALAMVRFGLLLAVLPCLAQAGTNEAGKKFLEENKKKEGVITLPSGLQYKVLREGDGSDHPTADSSCECHYAGTTPSLTEKAIDMDESEWSEFDSSYKR